MTVLLNEYKEAEKNRQLNFKRGVQLSSSDKIGGVLQEFPFFYRALYLQFDYNLWQLSKVIHLNHPLRVGDKETSQTEHKKPIKIH